MREEAGVEKDEGKRQEDGRSAGEDSIFRVGTTRLSQRKAQLTYYREYSDQERRISV